jgi:V8-like Glu-specific endopeptidase
MIVTNHHVIPTPEQAAQFRSEFLFEENAAGVLQNPLTLNLEPQRCFWTSEKLDVTLVGLGKVESGDIAIIPIREGAVAKVGDHVSIVQHPSGGPKQIAVTNNRIVNTYDRYVHYLTDTLPGSSGSPVFLDSWQLLAIHHAGGNVRKNSRGDLIFANEGVLFSAVLSDTGFRAAYEAAG